MLTLDKSAIQPHEYFVTERAGYEHTLIHQTGNHALQQQIRVILTQISTEDVVRAALNLDQSKNHQTTENQFLLAISNKLPIVNIYNLGTYTVSWEKRENQYFLFLKST